MFSASVTEDGTILLKGHFDAAQVENARRVFDQVKDNCRVDFSDLEYISSAGLGLLLQTQKRLSVTGHSLTLFHMNKLVRDVFHIARFDLVIKIDD